MSNAERDDALALVGGEVGADVSYFAPSGSRNFDPFSVAILIGGALGLPGAGALAVAGIVLLDRAPFLSASAAVTAPGDDEPSGDRDLPPAASRPPSKAPSGASSGASSGAEGTKVPSPEVYRETNMGRRWSSRRRSG